MLSTLVALGPGAAQAAGRASTDLAVIAAPGSDIRTLASSAEPLLPREACAEVIVYVVRGSGEAPQSGDAIRDYDPDNPAGGYGATWDAFDPVDPETNGSSISADRVLDLTKDGRPTVPTGTPFMYDLVQKVHERVGGQLRLSWSPIRYPAVPVDVALHPSTLLWAIHGYPSAVTSGIRELNRVLKRQWELCGTNTRYVLAGYSQGADVVNSYLRGKILTRYRYGVLREDEFLGPTLEIARQIAGVALIADPNHDPADPESLTKIDPDLADQGGLVAGFRDGLLPGLAALTDSICIRDDIVCGQSFPPTKLDSGRKVHSNAYRNFIDYPVDCLTDPDSEAVRESAITCMADRIVWRLGVRNLVHDPLDEAESAPGTTGRDVAFFIDTTGSMQDDIDAALQFAYSQADRIVALDGRVALVQYRDNVDSVSAEIVTPFTDDMTEFQFGLSQLSADGGGDTPEALLHALTIGMEGLDWQYGASKAAVVLTDAGFHEPDLVGGETLPQVERLALDVDPVNVFPVVSSAFDSYRDLAARTSGEVISMNSGDTEQSLTEALDNIAARPSALLDNATYYAAAGREIHVDASASAAVDGTLVEYDWDWDGDGFTDETTSEPTANHTYPPGYFGTMQVLVVDDAGRSSNASASVLVEEEPTRGVVQRVPSASAMTARASVAGDHVALHVGWRPGFAEPDKWVVAVDGDPVAVAAGNQTSIDAAIDFQEEPWAVTVTPMDADGNYGAAYAAAMARLARQSEWYGRPVVWAVGAATGLAGFAAWAWLLVRRRRPQPAQSAASSVKAG